MNTDIYPAYAGVAIYMHGHAGITTTSVDNGSRVGAWM